MDNLATEPTEQYEEEAESLDQPEVTDEEVEETEEVESEESEESEHEESGLLALDGEEIPVDSVREWKKSHETVKSFQADYTRKTQALAEERKAFDARQAKITAEAEKLETLAKQLEADILAEDPKELEELREYDLSAYLKRKEQIEEKRKRIGAALSEASAKRQEQDDSLIAEERKKLVELNPTWLDDKGNTTEAYKKDIEVMNSYLADQGWTDKEIAEIKSAKQWQTIKDAAQYRALKSKVQTTKKPPKITKPGNSSQPKPKPKTLGSMLYGDD